jgi:AAA ATPase-like protein
MLYLFDDYTLDTQLYELRHAGVPCPLEPQVLAILLYRLQHRDRLITRQELLEHVWPERFISETTLDHRVMQVRQAIGDSGQAQRRMQTLQWYTAAGQGQRQVVFVTGEVGIGKTTLVDAFVTAIRGHDDIWVGRGQCIEHHGSGEAYRLQGELLLRHAIPVQPRPKPVSRRYWLLLAASRPDPGSCGWP